MSQETTKIVTNRKKKKWISRYQLHKPFIINHLHILQQLAGLLHVKLEAILRRLNERCDFTLNPLCSKPGRSIGKKY